MQLNNNSSVAKISVPDGFAAESADFQINRLSTSGITPPANKALADENIFDLSAVTGSNTELTSFSKAITFTVTYGSGTESSFDEATLDVYRYNTGTGSWDKMNCSLNTQSNTLTCSLNSFSVYGVFGQQSGSGGSSGSSIVGSTTDTPSCGDSAPVAAPDLFQIDVTQSTATLYFSPVPDNDDYVVAFSAANPSAEEHGAEVRLGHDGVQSFTIRLLAPGTTYYFKVRGQKGCMPGPWSHIKQVTTQSIAPALSPTALPKKAASKQVNGISTKEQTLKRQPSATPSTPSRPYNPNMPLHIKVNYSVVSASEPKSVRS